MYIKLYGNYGLLGHEKETVFTVGNPSGAAVCYDEYHVKIPHDLNPYVTVSGSIAIRPEGCSSSWMLYEGLIATSAGNPAIQWIDDAGKRHISRLYATRI